MKLQHLFIKKHSGLPLSRLPSDYSTLQLNDLPSNAQSAAVADILAVGISFTSMAKPAPNSSDVVQQGFGFVVPLTSIQIKPSKPAGSLATVKFDDPGTAKLLVEKINGINRGENGNGELSVRVVESAAKFGSRLQLSSVSCTW